MSEHQKLNSLNRFRKQSPHFVLEEHGHCEVPAGCGGVVLRWRNPHAAVPLTLSLWSPGRPTVFLDDKPLESTRFDVAPGRHGLAIHLENADLSAGLLMFAAGHDTENVHSQTLGGVVPPFKVISKPDGTWKFALQDPGAGWQKLAFSDHDWPALVRQPAPNLAINAPGEYASRRCAEQQAACLGVPSLAQKGRDAGWWKILSRRRTVDVPALASGPIWIRKVFDVPLPDA